MKRLAETHGRTFELGRHFLRRMFDSEMFATGGQWRSLAIGALALLLPAGMLLLDPRYAAKYRELSMRATPHAFRSAVMADELALLTLVCAITGIIGLLQWQSLFPSARDYLAMASLPVRPRQIFTARFASVLLFSVAVVVSLNLLPSILAPLQFTGRWQTNPSYLANFTAQAVSSGLACFFILFTMIALQGVMLNVLPARLFARVSPYVQGALIAVLFLGALCSWSIADWQDALERFGGIGAWAPPAWFTGLRETMLGDRDPFLVTLSGRALFAVAAAALLTAVTYLLSYRRYRRLLVEAPAALAAARRRRWSALRLLGTDPRRQAVFQFLTATLARSRMHRMVLLAYIGAALGFVVNSSLIAGAVLRWPGSTQAMQFAALFWPISLSIFIISGVRHAFSLPSELPANWMFRATESLGRREWMSAVERFVIVCAIVPIYAVFVPVGVASLGWEVAARMTVLQVAVSLAIFEIRFHSWQQLPFTCSYVPGKRPLTGVLLGYLAALGIFVPIVACIIAAASRMAEISLIYGIVFISLWLVARHFRRDGWGEAPLIYDDLPDALPDLGIKEMTYGAPAALDLCTVPNASQRQRTPTTWRRLRAMFQREQLDRDLEDEMAFHLAMREERLRSEGVAPEEARVAARRQFGNVTRIRETCRGIWTFARLETFWQDLRYGARQLRRSPGFAVPAAVTLALGIGATTAVYSLLAAILWRPVPLPDVRSIVFVYQAAPGRAMQYAFAPAGDIEEIRRESTVIDNVAFWALGRHNLVDAGGEALVAESARVSPNLFDMLHVQPALGRAFLPGEDQPGRERVVILGHDLWRLHFRGDPSIIGRTIRVNQADFTVVGVMPPDFRFPRSFRELWVPLVLASQERMAHDRAGVEAAGRLRAGRTLKEAAAELDAIAARLEKQYPETNQKRRFVALPFDRYWYGDLAAVFAALMLGASVFVLLIACVNVANLQFARAASRSREVAVRVALGSGRTRLVRQLLTESLLLAFAGAVLGLVVAKWTLELFKAGIPAEMRHYMPGWAEIGLNPQAFRFALAAALASGIIAGLAPALRCLRVELTESLKEGGHGSSAGPGRSRWRGVLIAGEIAMSTVLLVGSVLMVRGFRALASGGAQLRPAAMLTMRIALSGDRYRESFHVADFYRRLLERAAAIPGVQSAVAATGLPYSRRYPNGRFSITGREKRTGEEPGAMIQSVTPDYFHTMFVSLRSGRLLADSDGPRSLPVAVISASAAQRWWKGEDPVGKRINLERRGPVSIVGVVGDIPYTTMSRDPSPTIYVPFAQAPDPEMDIGLRTARDPAQVAADMRAVVKALDPELPITNLNTMDTLMRQESFGLALMAGLMGTSGLLALLLSAVGVYGVTSYSISGRTHEVGIRMAVGARRGQVVLMFFRSGVRSAVLGLVLGLIPAWGIARVMQSFIWGVKAGDAVAFVGVPLVLVAASAIAVSVPAVRATRIDPVQSLHHD